MKALVIEDRTAMSQMFCGIIERLGVETKVSPTLSGALEDLETFQPQMVILDTSANYCTHITYTRMIPYSCSVGKCRSNLPTACCLLPAAC